MSRGIAPIVLGMAFGRRLPLTNGTLRVDGLDAEVTIRRDRWGIPHIDAQTDADAFFALGFCQGQDRAFQLETVVRVVRGTLAELVGPEAVGIDRLSRRFGFARTAEAQLPLLAPHVRAIVDGFVAGVNAGRTIGLRRRPHEMALLRGRMTEWTSADPLGLLKLMGLALASNWDLELARQRILTEDGPEALADVEPTYPSWHHVAVPPGALAGDAIARVVPAVAALERAAGVGGLGGSNNWAIAPSRTVTGRPILANDPHLGPTVPAPWYLAHVRTPTWGIAGAAFAGGPAFPLGHNGFASWGITAGFADITDAFIEEIGPDGASVREGDAFVPCEVRHERIDVKSGAPMHESVLITRRGPIIVPPESGRSEAVSFRATFLDPRPAEGLLALHRVRSYDEFRAAFRDWREASLNVVYADAAGTIGYQLIGDVPQRDGRDVRLPARGATSGDGWAEDALPFDALPHVKDPPSGFVATANARPMASDLPTDIGVDFADGYRVGRIVERLAARSDWDLPSTLALQIDVASIPWREMRTIVLDALAGDPSIAEARRLLEDWDGRVAADSSGAALYELFAADLCARVAKMAAPRSYRWALGAGVAGFTVLSMFSARRVGHLVRSMRERPDGWHGRAWDELIRESLRDAWAALTTRSRGGRVPAWGAIRTLTLRHAFTGRRPIDRAFDLGPLAFGGDSNTIQQALPDLLAPTTNPGAVPTVRAAIDVGDWDRSRFVLPGGQSGNPCSPHYDDLLPLYLRGDAVELPWTEQAVAGATKETLCLTPALSRGAIRGGRRPSR
jgi:penicillin G amidase